MSRKTILVNSVWSTADYFVQKFIAVFVVNVFMARMLTPAAYGIFTTAVAAASSLWVIADFGISRYSTREVAAVLDAKKSFRLARELQSIRFVLALALFIVGIITVQLAPLDQKWKASISVAFIYIVTYALYPDWYFRARGNFSRLALANFLSSAIYAAGVFIFIDGPEGVNTACLLWAVSYIPAIAVLLMLVRKKEGILLGFPGAGAFKSAISHIKESKDFLLLAILNNLYISIPIYLVLWLMGEEAVGYFNVSYRLYLYVTSILLPVSHVFFPLLSKTYSKTDVSDFKDNQKYFQRLAFVLILPVVLIVGMFGDEIISILYGKLYEGSARLLGFFALPIFLSTIRLTLANPLAASRNQKYLVYSSCLAVLSIGLSGYLLIVRSEILGAVYAIAISESIFCFSHLYLYNRFVSRSLRELVSGYSWKAIVATVLMGAVMAPARKLALIGVAAGILTYCLALMVLGELKFLLGKARQ